MREIVFKTDAPPPSFSRLRFIFIWLAAPVCGALLIYWLMKIGLFALGASVFAVMNLIGFLIWKLNRRFITFWGIFGLFAFYAFMFWVYCRTTYQY